MPPKLTELTYEEAVEVVFEDTRPADWMYEVDELKEGPTRELIERELALAIYREWPGTERMACPPHWRESFVAGDELRDKYLSIPDEELAKEARWFRSLSDQELEEIVAGETKRSHHSQFLEEAGITDELQNKALGPDRDRITQEEATRRITEYLSDVWFGEKAFSVHKLVTDHA